MRLNQLLEGVDVVRPLHADPDIQRVARAAEGITPESLFAACRFGAAPDPGELRRVVRMGAPALLVDEQTSQTLDRDAPAIVVRGINRAYATVCANLFGNAHRRLRLYGVTGTKGKTTTCHLVESIFRCAGLRTGLISSLVRRVGRREVPSQRTTPDAGDLHRTLAKMSRAGATHVVIEVSSIGIAEDRLHGLRFDGLAFTNIAAEHVAYHGGFENYKAAKARIFLDPSFHQPQGTVSALNIDDPFGAELAARSPGPTVTYGLRAGDITPSCVRVGTRGLRAEINGVSFESSLVGAHNLHNVLAAVALTKTSVSADQTIARGVSALRSLPGRFERVTRHGAEGVDLFVDAAHTAESVRAALEAARAVANGRRRIVLVGCRGGTDREKRSPIAHAAVSGSDICIVTTGNPIREPARVIIADMLRGLPVAELTAAGRLEVIVDRREAIYRAIEAAAPDGVVVLLGRGAEATQTIGRCEVPFDDREIARAALVDVCAPPSADSNACS